VNIERLKQIRDVFDFPSGVVMTLMTFEFMGIAAHAHLYKQPIDSTLLTFYGAVLTAFGVNKTMRAMKKEEEPKA
jgi:uncharacterized membrane protein